jgi:predicted membrane protein
MSEVFDMPLVQLMLALIVVAAIAWFINMYVPMNEKIKPIVNLVLALVVIGMFLWLINVYVPMAASIKAILNIVVVVATCVFVLQTVGLWERVVALWNKMISSATRASSPPPPAEGH